MSDTRLIQTVHDNNLFIPVCRLKTLNKKSEVCHIGFMLNYKKILISQERS